MIFPLPTKFCYLLFTPSLPSFSHLLRVVHTFISHFSVLSFSFFASLRIQNFSLFEFEMFSNRNNPWSKKRKFTKNKHQRENKTTLNGLGKNLTFYRSDSGIKTSGRKKWHHGHPSYQRKHQYHRGQKDHIKSQTTLTSDNPILGVKEQKSYWSITETRKYFYDQFFFTKIWPNNNILDLKK